MTTPPPGSREAAQALKENLRVLTRTVTQDECRWLDHAFIEGQTVFLFHGPTYGCIGPYGVAVSMAYGEGPFFELPADALRAALAPPADGAGEVQGRDEVIKDVHDWLTSAAANHYTLKKASYERYNIEASFLNDLADDIIEDLAGGPLKRKWRDVQGWRKLIAEIRADYAATIERLTAELSEERARRVEWQPIETAPRDGTQILACQQFSENLTAQGYVPDLSIVKWDDREKDFVAMADGYMSIKSQGDTWTIYHEPYVTHWRPLPTPPATHKDTQDE